MERTNLQQQYTQLLKMEAVLQVEFTAAKNRLIKIRSKRREIEKLLQPPAN